jgi:tight adherence protein C
MKQIVDSFSLTKWLGTEKAKQQLAMAGYRGPQAEIAIFAAYLGIKAPELFLKDATGKRQVSMRRAFPAAMDLLLICVESGMSIEHAFRKVSQEIGTQSLPLAEEFTLATAESAYLPDRRQASKISARAPESNPFSKSPRCSSRRKNTARRLAPHCAWWRRKAAKRA